MDVRAIFQGTTAWLALLMGCSGNPADYPDTSPVTGTVLMDGEPLEGAQLRFDPGGGVRPSSGVTDASGQYAMQYSGTVDGAVPGSHRVEITKRVADPNDPDAGPVNLVPKIYSGEESELTAEVKGGKNTIDFELTSK